LRLVEQKKCQESIWRYFFDKYLEGNFNFKKIVYKFGFLNDSKTGGHSKKKLLRRNFLFDQAAKLVEKYDFIDRRLC